MDSIVPVTVLQLGVHIGTWPMLLILMQHGGGNTCDAAPDGCAKPSLSGNCSKSCGRARDDVKWLGHRQGRDLGRVVL